MTRTGKKIGETGWLTKSPFNLLTLLVVWYRFVYQVHAVREINRKVYAQEGRRFSAVVCQNLPTACTVVEMLEKYARAVVSPAPEETVRFNFNLTAEGKFEVICLELLFGS